MSNLLSHLSSNDLDLYAHLPRVVKDEAAEWFEMIAEIEGRAIPSPLTGRGQGEGSLQGRSRAAKIVVLRKFAARLGKSVAQCTRKYYEWLNGNELYPSGDWRILVNRKKAGPSWWQRDGIPSPLTGRGQGEGSGLGDVGPLPRAFLEYWRKLCGLNQRGKCETQYRELIRQWERWRRGDPTAAIPGYDSPPDSDHSGRSPRGWSYRNLMRHKPVKVEMALVTQGTAAALRLLPHVPRTRVGVRFLEYVFFDDVWLDRKCIVPGYREPARILQLGCLDLATGVYLKFGQRPELPNPKDSARLERLKERDMKWLVAVLLEEYGYPADYDMHLIVERGTATLREPEARALYDLSNGRIKVCRTSMEGKLVLSWEERSTGNPRGKGPLESWHNLLHNESACLPGQMGKDREHAPAELFGREKEAVNLHAASLILTPEQRSRLRLPFPTKDQAHMQTVAIIDRINSRTDHDLDGFDASLLWRIKGTQMEWRPETELAALLGDSPSPLTGRQGEGSGQGEGRGGRAAGHPSPLTGRGQGEGSGRGEGSRRAGINPDLLEYTTRKESPLERMVRLSQGIRFEKFPAGELCRFYEDCHVLVKLSEPSTVIEFTRDGRKRRYCSPFGIPGEGSGQGIPSPLTGRGQGEGSAQAQGAPAFLEPGEYLIYYRPDDFSRVHLTRDGKYVTSWDAEGKVRPGDTAALAKAIHRKAAILNHHIGNVRRRHRDVLEQREADLRNNETVLAEAGVLPDGAIPSPLTGTGQGDGCGSDAPYGFPSPLTGRGQGEGCGSQQGEGSGQDRIPSPLTGRGQGEGCDSQGEGCGSQLQRAVAEHAQHKADVVHAERAEQTLSDLADEALLANIKPDLED